MPPAMPSKLYFERYYIDDDVLISNRYLAGSHWQHMWPCGRSGCVCDPLFTQYSNQENRVVTALFRLVLHHGIVY